MPHRALAHVMSMGPESVHEHETVAAPRLDLVSQHTRRPDGQRSVAAPPVTDSGPGDGAAQGLLHTVSEAGVVWRVHGHRNRNA